MSALEALLEASDRQVLDRQVLDRQALDRQALDQHASGPGGIDIIQDECTYCRRNIPKYGRMDN